MYRRRFLELLTASPALAANWLAGLKGGTLRKSRVLPVLSLPCAEVQETRRTGVMLAELLARKTLPLGTLRSHRLLVSLDDIASPGYLARMIHDRNALVISVYSDSEKSVDSALRRAVLDQLRATSPDDYRDVCAKLIEQSGLKPGSVVALELRVPLEGRRRFPVDVLVAIIFKEGWSSQEDFNWVVSAFEIAENRKASNLIVPCLGRNWRDRHSIDFGTFFGAFLRLVPSNKRALNVYFSLYGQWPSFELENATASLNAAWRKGPV